MSANILSYADREILPPGDARVFDAFPEANLVTFDMPSHDDPRWHELRKSGIGSSDAPAIVGLSPWKTPIELWKIKRGELPPGASSDYARFGSWFESYIIDEISRIEGVDLYPGSELGILSWNHWPIAQANIDAYNREDGTIEEIKTTSDKWSSIPNDYLIQVQHQLMVTGASKARIRQFICPVDRRHVMKLLYRLDGFEDENVKLEMENVIARWLFEIGSIETHEITRDDELINDLYQKEAAFWECVKNGTEPNMELDGGLTIELDDDELFSAFESMNTIKSQLSTYNNLKTTEADEKERIKNLITIKTSLLDENPKRITCRGYKATFCERKSGGSYWKL